MTPGEILQLKQLITQLDKESSNGDMFSEAMSQWLESCLESPNDYEFQSLWNDLESDTLYWLEGVMNDCDQTELQPGGLYHWMTLAVEHSYL